MLRMIAGLDPMPQGWPTSTTIRSNERSAPSLLAERITFAGSDAGGEHAAAMYSLIEAAKLKGIDPEAYLRDVLARIADHPNHRIL